MRNVVLLTLICVLLTGCAAKRKTVKLPPPPLPPPLPQTDASGIVAANELRTSAAVLEQLIRSPQNQVPDAVLNRTKCLVLILAPGVHAISTCRDAAEPDRWSTPAIVRFSGNPTAQPAGTDWLLFVLADRAMQAFQSGSFDLHATQSSPGLLERQTPAITDADLKDDVVSYRWQGGALTGASFQALSLSLDRSETARLFGRDPQVLPVGDSQLPEVVRQFIYWVTSYFKTITPERIIIHHTAIVPATRRVPTNAMEVDHYHESRGFGILCMGREYHAAYHYMIFPDGRIQAGRPERCAGAHARGYNAYLGISLVGDFSSSDNRDGKKGLAAPTRQQLDSLVTLAREIRRRYNIPIQHVLRHSDASATACPGDRVPFKKILLRVERAR